jgi:GTPase SAR1 family protein
MYCLQVYRNNSLPEENQLLIKQLWDQYVIQYDIKRTHDLLIKECTYEDLIFDIDCRRRHLLNLISLYKRFCGRTQSLLTTEYMVNELIDIIRYLKENVDENLDECKSLYRGLISETPNDKDIGLLYISLCERLQHEITEAEYCSMFPKTNAKINEWLHQQGSAHEFKPKLLDLFKIIEQDLMNQWSNSYMIVRTKIGVIGYTSTGKSSLINCLIGVQCLTEDDAAPVSNNRSTYFPLQFDRKEPLIDPNNQESKTFVTFVDIQGVDRNQCSVDNETKDDIYLEEIYKADCDIYMLVYDEELNEQQQKWIEYIEEILKRKCVLVRSKMDIQFLAKFQELSGTPYAKCDRKQRKHFEARIREQLRLEYSIESRSVYFIACDYCPSNNDALLLLQEQAFDYSALLDELSRLAIDACSYRIHALATRIIARAINTSFRRGYVLNVMKYKVAAGFASIIPFGDQLPRYLSRDSIRDAFGIDETFRQYLKQFHLIIYNYKLQTSVFEDCVEIKESQIKSKLDAKWVGRTAGTALIVGGALTDDVLRVAAPTAVALSGAARVVFSVATIGLGLVISAGVSAWSAVESGKHIFSYINRMCDDIIMIANPLIMCIIEREREKVSDKNQSTASTTDSIYNE